MKNRGTNVPDQPTVPPMPKAKNNCLFCALEENGDIPEDTEDLFDEKFDFIQIQIGNNVNDFNLEITDGKFGASVLYSRNLKFNFCPMCGRNLREAREKNQ